MTLNVQPDGTIQADGELLPIAAMWERVRYQNKPSSTVVRKLPYPFTFPLPNGATGIGAAGDYLVVDETGKPLGTMTQAQLDAQSDTGPGKGIVVG